MLLLGLATLCSAKTRYDDWFLLKVNYSTPFQLQMVRQMVDAGHHLFFDTPGLAERNLVMVKNWNVDGFYNTVEKSLCAEVDVVTENIQEWFDAEKIAEDTDDMSWDKYHKLYQIYGWMEYLTREFPAIASTFSIGKTYENRDIMGLKIEENPENPAVLVLANTEAREWISTATTTWLINELLTSSDPVARNLRETINWYFLPAANPDGFWYSTEEDRVWRKTRKPNRDSWCVGTDFNRNFEYRWNSGVRSRNPCGTDYAGSAAKSEVEVLALSNFINRNAKKFTAFFDLHADNQLLMYPFGTKDNQEIRNEDEHQVVGAAMIEAIAKRYGTEYKVGEVKSALYEVSGSVVDWVKGMHDVPFVWQVSMRRMANFTPRQSFTLGAEEIIPNSEEMWDGLVTFVNEARKLGYFKEK